MTASSNAWEQGENLQCVMLYREAKGCRRNEAVPGIKKKKQFAKVHARNTPKAFGETLTFREHHKEYYKNVLWLCLERLDEHVRHVGPQGAKPSHAHTLAKRFTRIGHVPFIAAPLSH